MRARRASRRRARVRVASDAAQRRPPELADAMVHPLLQLGMRLKRHGVAVGGKPSAYRVEVGRCHAATAPLPNCRR